MAPQTDVLDLLSGAAPGVRSRLLEGAGAYHGTGGARRAWLLAATAPTIAAALRGTKPDVLHVNNGGWPGSDLCRLATWVAAGARVPRRLMTVNSMPWPREDSMPRLQALVDRLTWASVEEVSTPARVVGEALVADRGLPARKFCQVRYGVPEPRGGDDEVAALRARLAPGGGLLAGMVTASASKEKGFAPFLGAMAQTSPEISAVVVGPYPEGYADQLRDRGLGERVTLEGPVADAGPYYRAIDLLVVPSIAREAMPHVILEAAAAHRPAIGTRLSGIPEAIADGETGVLVDPGDEAALARALEELAREPERIGRMGEAARTRWKDLYSAEALASAALDFYEGRLNTMNRYGENHG